MGGSLAMKVLSVVAMGTVLAHLFPVAAGMLLCIGDGADPDCCRTSHASQPHVDQAEQFLGGSECSCCIKVDAAPSTAGAAYQKASLELLSGPGLLRHAVPSARARIPRAVGHDPADSRLASLRTVVLLI